MAKILAEIVFFYLGIFKVRLQKKARKGPCKDCDLDVMAKDTQLYIVKSQQK